MVERRPSLRRKAAGLLSGDDRHFPLTADDEFFLKYSSIAGGGGGGGGSSSPASPSAVKESTYPLRVWMEENRANPYPTKNQKLILALVTKLTLTQVSTWFANARRRLKKERRGDVDYPEYLPLDLLGPEMLTRPAVPYALCLPPAYHTCHECIYPPFQSHLFTPPALTGMSHATSPSDTSPTLKKGRSILVTSPPLKSSTMRKTKEESAKKTLKSKSIWSLAETALST